VGPFEEEEEGTGIVSDVVKVEGAESGHPRSPDLRNDNGTAISPISGQQNQATHTHKKRHKSKKKIRASHSSQKCDKFDSSHFFVTEKSDTCDVTHPNLRREVGKKSGSGTCKTDP